MTALQPGEAHSCAADRLDELGEPLKKFASALATVVAAAGLFTTMATGTATAAPVWTTPFSVDNAFGWSSGKLNFYQRSLQITGTVQSRFSGCTTVHFSWWDVNKAMRGNDLRTACGTGPGSDKGFTFTGQANVPGGAERVLVEVTSPNHEKWSQNYYNVGN
ncbi:hypothetical protein [Streptomyces sp. NPDC002402]